MAADSRVIFSTELDESGLKNGLNKLKGGVSGLAVGVGTALGNIAVTAFSSIVTAVANSYQAWIDTASNLSEVQNVVNTTFGEGASKVNAWAKSAKEAYGMSELKAKQFASTMGAMLKSMGLSENQTLSMSEAMAGLAGDMASFYNLDYDTAFEKLRSGISGETEPLKQLGINMSVANLEAFALSKGIKTSYDKMTQAAQATLRYNYILSVTADAQGDFAKTSDGYANQQRILATTQEELAATIGDLLLPAAIEWTKKLNSMVEGLKKAVTWIRNLLNPPTSDLNLQINEAKKAVESFDASVQAAGNHLDVSLESAKATQATAASLLSNYESIISKNVLTDEDTAQLRSIASQIVQLYPDMAKYIDETTGQFNTNTTAIRNNINALADSQMATAYYTATQEYRTALLDSAVAQQKAQKAYDDAYANWQSKSIDLSSIEALYSAVTSNTQASAQYAGQLKMLDSRFDGFFDRLDDGTYVLNDFGQQAIGSGDFLMLLEAALVNVSAEEQKASSATVDLFTTLETANEATATATENLASATTACEQYGDVLIYTANTNDGLVQSQEDSIATTDEQSAALAALKETLKSLADQTLKTVESQVSGFEKMGRVGKQSARSTISALKSQQKYMTDYSTNLDKAREKGVSEEVLAALSDGTTESAKILAGLAKANQTQVDQINELYAATQQQKTELATTLADEQAKLVEANQSLADTGADAGTAVAATGTNTAAELAKARGEAAAAGQGISAAATTAKTAETSIETSKENAKTATQEMVDGVGQIVEDSASDIEQTGADIVDSVATGIKNNNAAKNALRSQVSVAMASARSTSYTGGRSIGTNIMRGLHDGLAGMSDNLNAAMKTIVYSLLKAAKDAAGVKSPSTLFRDQLGNYLAQGIGVGFSGTMNEQVLPTIAASIGAAAKAGQDVLDNTLLAKVQRITGLQLPSMASVTNSIMRGSAIATAAAGATYNSTTINAQQYVTFEKQMQAPDEIARSIRRNATYGLAGAKA